MALMGNLRAIYIIWYLEVLRMWRDRMRLVTSIAFPVFFLIVFGLGLKNTMGMLADGVDYPQFIFPGVIGMTVLMTAFMSGVSIVWEREFGFLKAVLVAPVSRVGVAIGKTLGGATIAMFQGVLILVLSPLVNVHLSLIVVLKLLPLMLVLAFALGSLGILIASRVRSMEAFQGLMQVMVMPMIFLSGVFFPVLGLPSWLSALVKVNPVTYGVDALRQLLLGAVEPPPSPGFPDIPGLPWVSLGVSVFGHTMSIVEDIAVVAGFGIIMLLGALWSFQRQD